MRILVLSNTPWNDNNSFGNSYSNIFSGMENIEYANIYLRSGNCNNDFDMQCFQITTNLVAKSIFNRQLKTGKKIDKEKREGDLLNSSQSDIFAIAQKKRWIILFWIREFIWTFGKWKTKELLDFVDDYNPDFIFQPIYGQGCAYINRIALFIKEYTQKPMFGYVSDDCYTLHQFSLSVFYWIDRVARRRLLKKVMTSCEVLYVISNLQKIEYESMLGVKCKVLTKGIKTKNEFVPSKVNSPIKLIYAGNIGEGRWENLAAIGKALDQLNQSQNRAYMDIYTTTPMTRKMVSALTCASINMKGAVDLSCIRKLYESADILIHVESMRLKSRLLVRQSFSTKLVDYFEIGKCIFAAGPSGVASIEHLRNNEAAIVVTDKKKIMNVLKKLIESPEQIQEYGKKAWLCGRKYHQSKKFQEMLLNDFKSVLK